MKKEGKGSKMKKILLGFVSIIVSIVVAAMSAAYIAEFKDIMNDIINSGELESIVQDAVDSSIDDLETMDPDAEENKLSGTWIINDALSLTDETFNENIEFISSYHNYSRFAVNDTGIYYETDANSSGYENMIYDTQKSYTPFKENLYRIVDFGSTNQEVSEEFYVWFTANSVCLSDTSSVPEDPEMVTVEFAEDFVVEITVWGMIDVNGEIKFRNFDEDLSNASDEDGHSISVVKGTVLTLYTRNTYFSDYADDPNEDIYEYELISFVVDRDYLIGEGA